MLEITKKNCYKCDLEIVIDNNSQYFWINLRDLEAEAENKWLNIFNKYGNKSTLKYRKELTPNIKFQADRIFVRNDLFEQVIKSCKSNSREFLKFKEKLGICPYRELNEKIFEALNEKSTKDLYEESYEYSDEEIDKTFKNNLVKRVKEVLEKEEESNKESTKKLTKELIKESTKKSNKETDNKSNK